MSERLLHYSAQPIESVRSTAFDDEGWRVRNDKPRGLWVSVEGHNDWRSYCEENWQDGLPTEALVYEVRLATSANILRIGSAHELREFSTRERCPSQYTHGRDGIGWLSLATRYSGIIIAPYQWECRLLDSVEWYYSWDCASGCIWDASAIASLTHVDTLVAPTAERAET